MRINGVEVSQAEIIALKPSDIAMIEYHDNPGLRYNNAGAVIDFIVKQKENGGHISGNFTDGVSNTGYGENSFTARYNYKQSELSANVYWGRRDIEWNRENYELFRLPATVIERTEIGDPTQVKYDDVNVALNYNLQDNDNYLLNIRFRTTLIIPQTPSATGSVPFMKAIMQSLSMTVLHRKYISIPGHLLSEVIEK